MRHINISELGIDDEWKKRSQDALEEARGIENSQERAKFINSKSSIWKDLKPHLEQLSANKCWYCESREKRSDRAVDHYRPKNNVAGSDHDGYWWLAFSPDNYRLSCTYCNSRRKNREGNKIGGKGDLFPLWDETKRVCDEKDDSACKHEDPLLIDPCKRSDVELLWFDDDGRAVSKYSEKDRPHAFKKAEVSIDCYHLNEREIKEARLALYHSIKKLIKQGDYYFDDALSGEPNAENGLSETITQLEQMILPEAEFSAFAKSIISGFRSIGKEWLETV